MCGKMYDGLEKGLRCLPGPGKYKTEGYTGEMNDSMRYGIQSVLDSTTAARFELR
jgi:hypothetical protein